MVPTTILPIGAILRADSDRGDSSRQIFRSGRFFPIPVLNSILIMAILPAARQLAVVDSSWASSAGLPGEYPPFAAPGAGLQARGAVPPRASREWDARKSRACVCDAGYTDVDCARRACAVGADVRALDHPPHPRLARAAVVTDDARRAVARDARSFLTRHARCRLERCSTAAAVEPIRRSATRSAGRPHRSSASSSRCATRARTPPRGVATPRSRCASRGAGSRRGVLLWFFSERRVFPARHKARTVVIEGRRRQDRVRLTVRRHPTSVSRQNHSRSPRRHIAENRTPIAMRSRGAPRLWSRAFRAPPRIGFASSLREEFATRPIVLTPDDPETLARAVEVRAISSAIDRGQRRRRAAVGGGASRRASGEGATPKDAPEQRGAP